MRLALYPIILVAAELAAFAGLGQAYWDDDIYDLSTRDLGSDVVNEYYAREYDADHYYSREWAEPDITSVSTRELVAELESRLEARGGVDVQSIQSELDGLLGLKKKTKTQWNRIKKLKKKLKDHNKKHDGGATPLTGSPQANAVADPNGSATNPAPVDGTAAGGAHGAATPGGSDTPPAPVPPTRR